MWKAGWKLKAQSRAGTDSHSKNGTENEKTEDGNRENGWKGEGWKNGGKDGWNTNGNLGGN